jgi:hypothetical protein
LHFLLTYGQPCDKAILAMPRIFALLLLLLIVLHAQESAGQQQIQCSFEIKDTDPKQLLDAASINAGCGGMGYDLRYSGDAKYTLTVEHGYSLANIPCWAAARGYKYKTWKHRCSKGSFKEIFLTSKKITIITSFILDPRSKRSIQGKLNIISPKDARAEKLGNSFRITVPLSQENCEFTFSPSTKHAEILRDSIDFREHKKKDNIKDQNDIYISDPIFIRVPLKICEVTIRSRDKRLRGMLQPKGGNPLTATPTYSFDVLPALPKNDEEKQDFVFTDRLTGKSKTYKISRRMCEEMHGDLRFSMDISDNYQCYSLLQCRNSRYLKVSELIDALRELTQRAKSSRFVGVTVGPVPKAEPNRLAEICILWHDRKQPPMSVALLKDFTLTLDPSGSCDLSWPPSKANATRAYSIEFIDSNLNSPVKDIDISDIRGHFEVSAPHNASYSYTLTLPDDQSAPPDIEISSPRYTIQKGANGNLPYTIDRTVTPNRIEYRLSRKPEITLEIGGKERRAVVRKDRSYVGYNNTTIVFNWQYLISKTTDPNDNLIRIGHDEMQVLSTKDKYHVRMVILGYRPADPHLASTIPIEKLVGRQEIQSGKVDVEAIRDPVYRALAVHNILEKPDWPSGKKSNNFLARFRTAIRGLTGSFADASSILTLPPKEYEQRLASVAHADIFNLPLLAEERAQVFHIVGVANMVLGRIADKPRRKKKYYEKAHQYLQAAMRGVYVQMATGPGATAADSARHWANGVGRLELGLDYLQVLICAKHGRRKDRDAEADKVQQSLRLFLQKAATESSSATSSSIDLDSYYSDLYLLERARQTKQHKLVTQLCGLVVEEKP